MARFNNLHDVGVSLCDILRDRIDPTLDVLPAPPLDNPVAPAEALRVTLMWVTPQPTHRNDAYERRFDGTLEAPPVSLSGFYLVSSYGTNPAGEPGQAYNRLGQVLQVFDAEPHFQLPQPAAAAGEGALSVVLVPTAADLMEKIYSPFQMRHRPWALFEVGPIQLRSLVPLGPEQPVVHPGGIRLADLFAGSPPLITSLLPTLAGEGGRVRLNATYGGTVEQVRVGDEEILAVALTIPEPNGPVLFTLPATISAGAFDVTLRVDGTYSRPVTLNVRAATVPTLDAPAVLVHSLAGNLVLTGRVLATVAEVFIWPARGVRAPDEVIALPPSATAANSVTLTAADLAAANVLPGAYRLTVRLPQHVFPAFIELEFVA